MDHNSFGAFGYGDGSSFGGDSSKSGNQNGWSNWGQPSNQQPKYENPYENYGYAHQGGYTAFSGNDFGHFGTFPQKAGSRTGFGFNSALGPEWSKKHFGPKGKKNANRGPPQQIAKGPKPVLTTGKTPTSVLHELFKNINEEFTDSGTTPKRYICKLNVNGQVFEAEALNKKSAKHKCSEVAIKALRPDVYVEPFVEPVKAAPPVKKEKPQEVKTQSIPAAESQQKKQKRAAENEHQEQIKKPKLSPAEAAASLYDLMQRIISDSSENYVPIFEITEELPPNTEVKKEEQVETALETTEDGEQKKEKKMPKWYKDPATIFTVTLKFEEHGKQYQKSGKGRGMQRNLVVREALLDLFKVSHYDIKTVTLKSATKRLNHFSNVSTLYQIASILNCNITFDIQPSEAAPLGEGKPFYFAKCKIESIDDSGRTAEFKSSDSLSKTMAKEQVALLALTQFFEIDPSKCEKKKESGDTQSLGPAATLHTHLAQTSKNGELKINYEFQDVEPKTTPPTFICNCLIGDKKFTAVGSSKKVAKNNAAVIALKEIFAIDFNALENEPENRNAVERDHNVSQLCHDIAEFAKREYHGMSKYYNVRPSNQVACFFLVNEKGEKRLIASGSSMQNIVDTGKLNESGGKTLVHMDPIVLARRSLLRYFIQELAVMENDPENSVFIINKGKKADLKPNLQLILYANFPPVCSMSVKDAKVNKLAYVTPINFTPVPDDLMTSAEIRELKEIRIHCTADKIYKWNSVGLQGALLSNLLNTIKLNCIFFGTDAPVPDESLKFALAGRLGEDTSALQLESIATQMRVVTSYAQGWTRGIDSVEKIDHETGVTITGTPSKYSKIELFELYLKLKNADTSITNYNAAKLKGAAYQRSKKAFYNKLEKAGLGKWQTKPSEFLDNFNVTLVKAEQI